MLQRPEPELRSARFITLASLRWVIRHRAYTPWYLIRYWRLFRVKPAKPHVVTGGFVFPGSGARLDAPRGPGPLLRGLWLYPGVHTPIHRHEATVHRRGRA